MNITALDTNIVIDLLNGNEDIYIDLRDLHPFICR